MYEIGRDQNKTKSAPLLKWLVLAVINRIYSEVGEPPYRPFVCSLCMRRATVGLTNATYYSMDYAYPS